MTLGVIELDLNSVVPEHSHEPEQVGLCLAGSLRFRVGDETRELGPGTLTPVSTQVIPTDRLASGRDSERPLGTSAITEGSSQTMSCQRLTSITCSFAS